MKIVNPQVLRDLVAGRKLRLNLGCGQRSRPGFYGVDRVALPGVDLVADLNQPFAELPDDSVEEIYCRHTLEHVDRFLELIAELHRVTCAGGRIEIIVPHFSNPYGYSDPTHVRFFGAYSFYYFCDEADQPPRAVPAFYIPQRFTVETVDCTLLRASLLDRALRAVVQPLVNRNFAWLDWYERRLCRWLPADSIRYVLRPKKPAVAVRIA